MNSVEGKRTRPASIALNEDNDDNDTIEDDEEHDGVTFKVDIVDNVTNPIENNNYPGYQADHANLSDTHSDSCYYGHCHTLCFLLCYPVSTLPSCIRLSRMEQVVKYRWLPHPHLPPLSGHLYLYIWCNSKLGDILGHPWQNRFFC